ncbi:hypothetical protein [Leptospira sp. GIMC2001]|uniref:hypothetical protein n=1 Tax=Leptospira sp. GIMC2001 TaxID=1513297 RepID=UPI00234ADB4D|nr:hypothetical protein [Leptospira sp. GIMC2001]WCL50818.1 hypothetical protein O4O04_08400 [Leptospira sp. GIMC2001]
MERPTAQNVRSLNDSFYKITKNKIPSDTVSLFFSKFQLNTEIEPILMKVTLLNKLYSTNILDVYSVAIHIKELKVDNDLNNGNLQLIDKIKKIKIKEKCFNFYSFSTKFCNKHNSNSFPIYDSYVDKALCYFRDKDNFFSFKKQNLKDYTSFVDIFYEFRYFYELDGCSNDEIDIYLWSIGKVLIN